MPSYQQNKEHIYKWRAKNTSRHNELSAKSMVKYRLKKKTWIEIQKEFFNILLL
jgi:hypothetical protein